MNLQHELRECGYVCKIRLTRFSSENRNLQAGIRLYVRADSLCPLFPPCFLTSESVKLFGGFQLLPLRLIC